MSEEPTAESYVKLVVGKPVRMHFEDHKWMPKQITDPVLKWPKTVQTLVFRVDEVDYKKVDTIFSLISQNAIKEIEPYLAGKRYRGYDFVYTKDGPEFAPPRIVEVRPRR